MSPEADLPILVVDDEPQVVRTIGRLLRGTSPVWVAETFQQALAALDSGRPIAAAIIDVRLPDGSGLNLLPVLRERHPKARVLVLTGYAEPALINTAQVHGAEYTVKPHFADSLRAFATRVIAEPIPPDSVALPPRFADFVRQHRLTSREAQVVLHSLSKRSRQATATRMGIAVNTVKSVTHSVLIKCRANNLLELADRIASEES